IDNLQRLFDKAKKEEKLRTQADLAAILDISPSMISAILNKEKPLPEKRIYEAAAFFGVSPREIRSDLPDFAPQASQSDGLDEQLLEEVTTGLLLGLKEAGVNLERITPAKFGRMVTQLYVYAKENKLDRTIIKYTIELMA